MHPTNEAESSAIRSPQPGRHTIIVLVLVSFVLLVPLGIFEINPGTGRLGPIVFVGYAFGILLALPLVAGAISGLVRSNIVTTTLLTGAWNLMVIGAWAIQLHQFYNLGVGGETMIIVATPFVLWLINLAIFSLIRWSKRLKLSLDTAKMVGHPDTKLNITLTDLFQITIGAAVALGIGRAAFLSATIRSSEYFVWGFLSLAPVIFLSPLIFAGLMPRRWWIGLIATGIFGVVVTAAEISVWELIGRSGPTAYEFVAINTWASLFALTFLATVRLCGMQLQVVPKKPRKALEEINAELVGPNFMHLDS